MIGPVFDVLPNGRVAINIVSIAFSTSSPMTYPPQLSTPDGSDGKRRKLQARAPRRPQLSDANPQNAVGGTAGSPVASTSTVLNGVVATNATGYISRHVVFLYRN